jgi:hypothetical protein
VYDFGGKLGHTSTLANSIVFEHIGRKATFLGWATTMTSIAEITLRRPCFHASASTRPIFSYIKK